jgi:hypothetical protein
MGETKRINTCLAPCCHSEHDAITDVWEHGNVPVIGDIIVCLYCGTPLTIVNLDPPEFKILNIENLNPQLQREIGKLQSAIRRTKSR